MKKLLTIAVTGIFVLSLQGPIRAQEEVAPPPIPPLLEDQRPLEHVETSKPAANRNLKQSKVKSKAKVKAKVKARKTKRRAKIKKLAVKKRQTVAKKRNQKASKKKSSAGTRRQAGPDEG